MLLLVLGIVVVYYGKSFQPKVTVSKNMYLLDGDAKPIDYEIISDNTMTCNLATVSNVIANMENDGFAITEAKAATDSLDIILSRDDCKIRVYYQIDGNFASIAVPYEKSYLPITYINEN
jgi:hypothetical protein